MPEDVDSLPAGMFCEACGVAIFPEEGETDSHAVPWIDEHMGHGLLWVVAMTPEDEVVTLAALERGH